MKFFLACILSSTLLTSSIYNISVNSASGGTINLGDYQNKKILIVNIATNSEFVAQLAKLQELQEEYSDSLVVIAVPSNSFGQETRTNSEVVEFCQNNYGVTFQIAAKAEVKGVNIHPLYNWLTKKIENGGIDQEVKGDFQKYLVNGEGEIIAVFLGSADPDHPGLIQAIEN